VYIVLVNLAVYRDVGGAESVGVCVRVISRQRCANHFLIDIKEVECSKDSQGNFNREDGGAVLYSTEISLQEDV